MEFSVSEHRKRGLSALLARAKQLDADRGKALWRPTILDCHPFGLPMPAAEVGNPPFEIKHSFTYIGDPGITDSTRAAAATISDILSDQDRRVVYLRVILGQAEDPNPQWKHDIHFEVGWPTEAILVSGCNDYSGVGKAGTMYMRNIFAFLRHHFDIAEVNMNTIDYHTTVQGSQLIRQAIQNRIA